MRKKLILFLFISSLFFLLGCVQDDDLVSGPFVGGSNGLEIGFVDDEPPDRVFDNNEEDFDIVIQIENVGEFDIPEGKVITTLGKIPLRDFNIENENSKLDTDLNGKSEFNGKVIDGDIGEIVYQNVRYKHDLLADFETGVRADVCYLYQTKATTKVCLKQKATERDLDDACQINNDNVDIFNSGAPVQISNVRTRSSGTNEVELTFQIENKGSGRVYPPDAFANSCMKDEKKEDRLMVKVITASGRHGVECNSLGGKASGEIKLSNGIRFVRCDISTRNALESATEEPVNIVVDYFYRNVIQKTLIVEDSEDN